MGGGSGRGQTLREKHLRGAGGWRAKQAWASGGCMRLQRRRCAVSGLARACAARRAAAWIASPRTTSASAAPCRPRVRRTLWGRAAASGRQAVRSGSGRCALRYRHGAARRRALDAPRGGAHAACCCGSPGCPTLMTARRATRSGCASASCQAAAAPLGVRRVGAAGSRGVVAGLQQCQWVARCQGAQRPRAMRQRREGAPQGAAAAVGRGAAVAPVVANHGHPLQLQCVQQARQALRYGGQRVGANAGGRVGCSPRRFGCDAQHVGRDAAIPVRAGVSGGKRQLTWGARPERWSAAECTAPAHIPRGSRHAPN